MNKKENKIKEKQLKEEKGNKNERSDCMCQP